MSLWSLVFQAEVVEQCFGTGVLSHHDQQASENGDYEKHGEEPSPSYYHAFVPIHPPIAVAFSTPTPDFVSYAFASPAGCANMACAKRANPCSDEGCRRNRCRGFYPCSFYNDNRGASVRGFSRCAIGLLRRAKAVGGR